MYADGWMGMAGNYGGASELSNLVSVGSYAVVLCAYACSLRGVGGCNYRTRNGSRFKQREASKQPDLIACTPASCWTRSTLCHRGLEWL